MLLVSVVASMQALVTRCVEILAKQPVRWTGGAAQLG